MAIAIDHVTGFVDLRDPNFIDGYAIIASDDADDVYIQQVATAPQDLLIADNSSFLNYQHIDAIDTFVNAATRNPDPATGTPGQTYRDVFVTNGSLVDRQVLGRDVLRPVTTATTTTTFRLPVQDFDRNSPLTGTLRYRQTDGSTSVWTFANYASPEDIYVDTFGFQRLFNPTQTITLVGGPGYPLGQAAAVIPGWVVPTEVSYTPGVDPDTTSADYNSATLTFQWSGLIDPNDLPTIVVTLLPNDNDWQLRNGGVAFSGGNFGVYGTFAASALISQDHRFVFALPDPFNKDSLGVIPGSFSGALELDVTHVTLRQRLRVRITPDGTVYFYQTISPLIFGTGNGLSALTGWTDVAVIATDGYVGNLGANAASGLVLVRGSLVDGNRIALETLQTPSLNYNNAYRLADRDTSVGINYAGFSLNSLEKPLNVVTFAQLVDDSPDSPLEWFVYNQDSQPNTVTFAPGHNFTREPTVDLLTPGSSLVINSPIDVSHTRFAIRGGSGTNWWWDTIGSVDFRATNIDINAPVSAPWRVDIGHSQTGDSERLTIPGEFVVIPGVPGSISPRNRFPSPTFRRDVRPAHGQVATAFAGVTVGGQVDGGTVTVLTEGSGYDPNDPPVVVVEAPEAVQGAAVVAAISGSVTSVAITSSGENYLNGANVTFSRPQTGSLGVIALNFGGSGYKSAPYVEIVGGGGTGAVATATVTNGVVTAITIVDPGRDYLTVPTIRLIGGGGSGAVATAQLDYDTATGIAVVVDDEVVAVQVTNPGSGYNAPPQVVIVGASGPFGGRPGAGAAAVASISGDVGTVRVSRPGTNYLNGGSGFVTGVVTTTDLFATFGDVQIPVINGELRDDFVDTITVVDGGSGYVVPPAVRFVGGGGNGAVATAVISGGSVVAILISGSQVGRGYTSAPRVEIDPPPAGGVTAAAYATLGAVQYVSRGTGYTNLQNARVALPPPPPLDPDSLRPAAFRANVSADGRIVGFTIDDFGAGYTAPPFIWIAPPPYQRPATAAASIDIAKGTVESIAVVDEGYRYKTPPLVVIEPPTSPLAGVGVTARAVATLDGSGRVTGITIIDKGSGYTSRPRVQIAIPVPVNHTEMLTIDANLRAPIYEIYVGDDFGTERPKGQMKVSPGVTLAQKEVNGVTNRATDLYIEATTADVVVEGAIRADKQTYLLNSDSFHSRYAPYYLTTRSLASNLQDSAAIIEGATVAITLGNDAPTPAMGASAFNVLDIRTRIDSLRVTAATSTPNPAGAFPYVMNIDEVDGISIDAVAASSMPLSIRAGGSIGITSALSTQGDLSIDGASTFTVSSPISSSAGRLAIVANDIQVNNSLRVPNATVLPGRTDVSLFARQGNIRLAGDITAVNDVFLRQQSGVDAIGLPLVGGQIDGVNARITAENIAVQSGGSVSLRTNATTLSGLASTGFALRELDDITVTSLEVPSGLVLLRADGVDRGDKGRNPVALTAALRAVTNLFVSTPNGSARVFDDTNRELVLGNGPDLYRLQGAAEPMQAAGDVTIRSQGGSIVALDAPVAGGAARAVRLATISALPANTTYAAGTPGVFGSVLSGLGSITDLLPSFGVTSSTVLAVDDLLLVRNQANARENGVYRVTKVGGGVLGSTRWELTRDAASDTAAEFAPGTLVRVLEGRADVAGKVYRIDYDSIPTTLVDRVNGNQIQLPADFAYANLVDVANAQFVSGTGIAPNSRVAFYDQTANVVTLDVDASLPTQANVTVDATAGVTYLSNLMKQNAAGQFVPFSQSDYANLVTGQPVYSSNVGSGVRIAGVAVVNGMTRVYVTHGAVGASTGTASVRFGVAGKVARVDAVAVVESNRSTITIPGSKIVFQDSFDRYGQLAEGQAVYGDGVSPGAKIVRIDPLTKTISVTPGAVPLDTTVQVDGQPYLGGATYPDLFDWAVKLDDSFNDFDDIRVGQLVSGPGFMPGARVTGIDPLTRTVSLNRGAIANASAVTSTITFEQPESISFGVVAGVGAGYATFAMPAVGLVPIRVAEQPVTTEIGTDDATQSLTLVVSTVGVTNGQAGSLGKMISVLNANDTDAALTNPDQDTAFRFWQYFPGALRLTQELPVIDTPVTIDGSLRYTGTAGLTGVTASNSPIFVDGSLITTTTRESRVSTASVTKTGSTTATNPTILLSTNQNTVGLVPGMFVVGDGIASGTRIASVNAGNRTITLDAPAIANSTGLLTFRANNVNGFVFTGQSSVGIMRSTPVEDGSGSVLRNISVGGFTSGSAVQVRGASNVVLDRLSVGIAPNGARATSDYGVTFTNGAAFNTLKDSRIFAGVQAGVRIEQGATENRIVGTTVGSADINNTTGIQIVKSDRNFIGTDEIQPLASPRTISAKVVSDPSWTTGTVLEVAGGVSFGYPIIGLQVFDTVSPSRIYVSQTDLPVRVQAVDTLTKRIYLDQIIPTTQLPIGTTSSLLLGNGGVTTAFDDASTPTVDESLQVTLLPDLPDRPGVVIDDLFVGQAVTGANIPSGTVIAAIDRAARVITLSKPATDSGQSWVAFGVGLRNTVQSNRTGIAIVESQENRVTNTTVINNTFDGISVTNSSGINSIGSAGGFGVLNSSAAAPPSGSVKYHVASYAAAATLTAGVAAIKLPATFPMSALTVGQRVFCSALSTDVKIKAINSTAKTITVVGISSPLTAPALPMPTSGGAAVSFKVASWTGSVAAASELYVGQSGHAVNKPDYTTITALRTQRSSVNPDGLIVLSTPQLLGGKLQNFTGITPNTRAVFAALGSTSNAIYGNKGFGVRLANAASTNVRGNNFNTGVSGEQRAANTAGSVSVSAPGFAPRPFDRCDAFGNRHGVARRSLPPPGGGGGGGGGLPPIGPGTPTV